MGTHGCFLFADYKTNDFAKAQSYCNGLYQNAYLAEIRSEDTQNLLTALAGVYPDSNWWLGASDFYQVLHAFYTLLDAK